MTRQSFIRIQVVASGILANGDKAQDLATYLTVGNVVEVQGFLNRHETKNGVAKLVLHAQQLKKI